MYIYLDNLRGFSNAFVPIRDVNFLVGENSTGKTSFLAFLEVLSSPKFWFTYDLHSDNFNFNHFNDLVSVHSRKRNYFRIGIVDSHSSTESDSKIESEGYLLTFREKSGAPVATQITYLRHNRTATFRLTKQGLFIKPMKGNSSEPEDQVIVNQFPRWIKEHDAKNRGYEKIKLPELVTKHGLLPMMLTSIMSKPSTDPELTDNDSLVASPDINIPNVMPHLVWLAPIRTQPKRTYDEMRLDFSPEGTHTPYIIRKLLDSKDDAERFQTFMRTVGAASGLFETVEIRRHGRGITAPFEVDIVLDQKALNLSNVGYGVSQSLPVLVEFLARPKGTWFGVQQPEVHLHPKAQAALGDVIFEMTTREKKRFVVETHSDYLIDRFRMNYRSRRKNSPEAQILFFERKAKKNNVHVIKIDKKGELPSSQPASYRRFFLNEGLRLVGG